MPLSVKEFSLKCYELHLRVKKFIIRYCDVLTREVNYHKGVNAMLVNVKELI